MNEPDRSVRPSQVTVAGWAVAIASVMLVVAVFDSMGQLQSVDMRERLAEAIDSGSAKGLGLTLDEALEIVRWCLYVSGVAAAASGILGVFVLQGHRGARIGVSVAAVSIVLTASVAGSFPGSLAILIAAAAALLWTRPARDWFAGRPVAPRTPSPEAPAPLQRESEHPVAWSPPKPGAAQPPPTAGWGRAPLPPPSATDLVWPAPGSPAVAPVQAARPSQLRLACILTWIFSSLTALGYLTVLLVLLADRDRLLEELQKSPGWQDSFDQDTVATVMLVASVLFVVWSIGAILLAVLAWRRVRWAWITLLVSTWTAGLVSALAFPFSLPYLAAIGLTAGKLTVKPTRAWFARQPVAQGPPVTRPQGPPTSPPTSPGTKPPVW